MSDCVELDEPCDPCEGLDAFDWNQAVVLSYSGVISTADELRSLIGNPSDDPLDPAGFVTDIELNAIISRHSASILEAAKRRWAEQRMQVQAAIDVKLSERDGAKGRQEALRQSKAQSLESSIAAAERALEVDVARLSEEYVRNGLPEKASGYFDEVEIPVIPSPTIAKVSYGLIQEPYLPSHIGATDGVTIVDGDELHPASVDPNIQRTTLMSSLFDARRYQIRGRYIYVTNNGRDIEKVFAWLTTRDRVEDFAREVSEARIGLDQATSARDQFDANPVTEADAEVEAAETALRELCVDPPVLMGDELVGDLVSQVNEAMRSEAASALQMASQVTSITQSAPDA